ncbi:MAG: hypothetical protein WC003_05205 [Terrimicrobiaceae bacterium]
MRFHFLLLAAFSLAVQLRAGDLADAAVTLPYTELRALIEAGKKPAPPEYPLPFAVLSAHYRLAPGGTTLSGTVAFDVRSFREGGLLIPLISDSLVVSRIEPADASIVIKDGYFNLVVDGLKRQSVTLHLDWKGKKDGETTAFQCGIHPAAISNLVLSPVPQGVNVDVAGAVEDSKAGVWNLGPNSRLEIRMAQKSTVKADSVVAMPAVVREANSAMRIVSDGTFFNSTTWKIRHNTAVTWRLALGSDTQVVSCTVAGRPAAPVLIGNDTIELRLPESDAETAVEIAYTGKTAAFAPVRGEFAASLPSTDLLVERSDWLIVLPSPYSPLAVEGNCEFVPGDSKNELRLRKELCRGESPAVRVFYQKTETTKKP